MRYVERLVDIQQVRIVEVLPELEVHSQCVKTTREACGGGRAHRRAPNAQLVDVPKAQLVDCVKQVSQPQTINIRKQVEKRMPHCVARNGLVPRLAKKDELVEVPMPQVVTKRSLSRSRSMRYSPSIGASRWPGRSARRGSWTC